jgi:L-ascorbate metabolism protein UlaG (beta-lactamase superfamily)
MDITWLGHAAFLIETSTRAGAVRIITDPFSSASGYDAIDERADVVTLSHQNLKYHSCLEDIDGQPELVHGLDITGRETETHDVRFGAVQVYEDEQGNGPNAMIWLQSEGLRVLHMGDIGHALNDEHLNACGKVDVLLAPTGGSPTISLSELYDFIARLQRVSSSRCTSDSQSRYGYSGCRAVRRMFPAAQVRHENTAALEVSADFLSTVTAPTIAVLQHAR